MTGTLHWCYHLVRNLTKEKAVSTITAHADHATLINVFTVQPDRARELADLLTAATEEVMQHVDGFISANIHLSTDGTRVVNYAQWRSAEAFQAMLSNPTARQHMGRCADLADSFEPHLYTVESVHSAP
jgi:quinol monooxygenase YgiN